MKPLHTFICSVYFLLAFLQAKAGTDSAAVEMDSSYIQEMAYRRIDSLIGTFEYKTGHITIGSVAAVDVPAGFKFLSARHAQCVLTELWNTPPDTSILGMLVPDSMDFFHASSWAICYSYEEDGHVK